MKKNILSLSAIALVAALFTGCNKEDTTAPIVTLTGDASKTISLQGTYTEEGATANDDEDGTITPTVSGTVNVDLTGNYIITYTATDAAGNVGTATRTVTVKNDADIYAGTYTTTNPDFGSDSPWTQTVTASTTQNKVIIFSKFAARTGNNAVEAILTGGTTFTLIAKTVSGLGSNSCTFAYTPNGAGNTISGSAGNYSFSIKYYEEGIQGGTGCDAVSATPFEDTFAQQ